MIEEKDKRDYVLIKDLNMFMYDHTLLHGRNHFCLYCLQDLRTAEKIKFQIRDYFKISGKQRFTMPKQGESVRFKSCERKIKSPFMIYADF